MPLAITDYFNVMQQRDFLREHQYRVRSLNFEGFALGDTDLVYLKTGSIPNRTVNTVPVPFMGLQFKVPGTVQYEDTMELTFYCDQPQIIRSVFERMSYAAFDDRYSGGAYTTSNANRLTFATYDNTSPEQTTTQYTLIGIIPTVVGSIAMNTTTDGSVTELPITIAYQYWEKDIVGVPVQAAGRRTVAPL